jgi:hypothetical protein
MIRVYPVFTETTLCIKKEHKMATNSMIGYLNADGTVVASFCAYDGYLSGIGHELTNYFKSEAKALALAITGDMKSIDNGKVDPLKNADSADEFTNINEFASHALNKICCNYAYIFVNKKWYYQTATDNTFYQVVLKPLAL